MPPAPVARTDGTFAQGAAGTPFGEREREPRRVPHCQSLKASFAFSFA